MLNKPEYIFIDADDTLWENERYFRDAEAQFAALLAPHARLEDIQHVLWEKQEDNIPYFGYGSKTYFMGMVDAALALRGGSLDDATYNAIRELIINLCYHDVHVFDGVEDTLKVLSQSYKLVLTTKGENMEQLSKFKRSGLAGYFHSSEILLHKTEEEYSEIASKYGVAPENVVMVGNSVRSDIVPVINIGGSAVYIPHDIVWVHEMADVPASDRLFLAESFTELPSILSKM